jgi:hypothetical protein
VFLQYFQSLNDNCVQFKYLDVTVQEKLRSGWAGLFMKAEGVVVSHWIAFSASRRLKFGYKNILPCTVKLKSFDSWSRIGVYYYLFRALISSRTDG